MMKLEEIGTRARQAEPVLRIMETEKKNRVLKKAAENLGIKGICTTALVHDL